MGLDWEWERRRAHSEALLASFPPDADLIDRALSGDTQAQMSAAQYGLAFVFTDRMPFAQGAHEAIQLARMAAASGSVQSALSLASVLLVVCSVLDWSQSMDEVRALNAEALAWCDAAAAACDGPAAIMVGSMFAMADQATVALAAELRRSIACTPDDQPRDLACPEAAAAIAVARQLEHGTVQ